MGLTMRIVVTTPTGHIGSRVARLLLQAGVRPTLLLRDPSRLDPETRERVETRQVDQDDADSVLRATEGATALFWLNPSAYDAEDPVAAYARKGENAARAVRAHGIAHTVFLSSVGAEKRRGAGFIDGLARTEEALDATGANVLHLRCGYFFTNLLMDLDSLRNGVLTTTMRPDVPMPWVDPRDIGDIAAAHLLSRAWSGRAVQAVHGPEDLSFARVAEIVSEATGRKVQLVTMSDEEAKRGLLAVGMGVTAAEGLVQMSRGLRDGFVPEQARSVLTTTPTTLAAWAYANLRPALAGA